MIRRIAWMAMIFVICATTGLAASSAGGNWRSALYPADWEPRYADSEGRFIQDFSFAGYHSGIEPIPTDMLAPIIDVTLPPYSADASGVSDATEAIQAAINAAEEDGGGTVYLPAGTYSLSPKEDEKSALTIRHSNVRLMGAGPEKTFLRLDSLQMRQKNLILVEGKGDWAPSGVGQRIAVDLTYPTQIIPLDGKPRFQVGDRVIITHEKTEEYVADHNMIGVWEVGQGTTGKVTHYRRVIAVDNENNTITIDVPTRYLFMARDGAAVYSVDIDPVEEVGISGFSIGMKEHPKDYSMGNRDWDDEGTGAWDIHLATAIKLYKTVNSWVQNVKSYKLDENKRYWILSMGVWIEEGRFNTISKVEFRNPQLRGGGTDGYLFWVRGGDNLVVDCAAYNGRHNYSVELGISSGNVFTGNLAYGRLPSPDWDNGGMTAYPSDIHFRYSPSNLIDNMTFDGNQFEAIWRGGTGGHTLTSSQTVFWNSNGLKYPERTPDRIITSEQSGWGYVIGTRGPAYQVHLGDYPPTRPIDYAEGIGESESLEPQSLYFDQLKRRLERNKLIDAQGLDFRPQAVRVLMKSPQPHGEVQGQVPVRFSVTLPKGESLAAVIAELDGVLLYKGQADPRDLHLDTTALADGSHELVVTAQTEKGEEVVYQTTFSSDNWWSRSDPFEPPLDSGWFGMVDRSRTTENSAGWGYAAAASDTFFGDADCRVLQKDGSEFLIWEAPHLVDFQTTVFARSANVLSAVQLAVSSNGESWLDVPYTIEANGPNNEGWVELTLVGEVEKDLNAMWFKLTATGAGIGPDVLQFGEVELRGLEV